MPARRAPLPGAQSVARKKEPRNTHELHATMEEGYRRPKRMICKRCPQTIFVTDVPNRSSRIRRSGQCCLVVRTANKWPHSNVTALCKTTLCSTREQSDGKKVHKDPDERTNKAAAFDWPFVGQVRLQEEYPTCSFTANCRTQPVLTLKPIARQIMVEKPRATQKNGVNGGIGRRIRYPFLELDVRDSAGRKMTDTFGQSVA